MPAARRRHAGNGRDATKVLAAVKLHSLKNEKMLTHAEFRDLARATLGKQAAE